MGLALTSWRRLEVMHLRLAGRPMAARSVLPGTTHYGRYRQAVPIFIPYSRDGNPHGRNVAVAGRPMEIFLPFSGPDLPDPNPRSLLSTSGAGSFVRPPKIRFN